MNITNVHIYDDIIDLPHPVSKKHKQMTNSERAAQFGSFAALTGHSDAIAEKGRYTTEKTELCENAVEILNTKLQYIQSNCGSSEEYSFTYFEKDKLKEGGRYITKKAAVKKIDEYEKCIYFFDGTKIAIVDICEIEGEVFNLYTEFADM